MRGVPRFRVVGGVVVAAVCLATIRVGAAWAGMGRPVDWRGVHAVATVYDSVVTDGDRYAAFLSPTAPDAVTVFDTRENRIVRTTPRPAGCGLISTTGTGVAGGGYALELCVPVPYAEFRTVRVLELATGHQVALPDRFLGTSNEGTDELQAVGSQWIKIVRCGSDCGTPRYLNWRTRRQRFPVEGERDLNSAELRRVPPATTRVFVRRASLWLARRGHRLLRLGRCGGVCPYEVSFAAGRVTWTVGLTLHGYLIRRARFYAHRFRRPPSCPFPPDGLLSAHTQYRILTIVDCSTATQQSRGLLYTGAW